MSEPAPAVERRRPARLPPMALVRAERLAHDIRDTLVIKAGNAFLLTDQNGNVPPGNPDGLGLYFEDMRHLSVYALAFEEVVPVVLTSNAAAGFSSIQQLTNPEVVDPQGRPIIPRETLMIERHRCFADGVGSGVGDDRAGEDSRESVLAEQIEIINYGREPVTLRLRVLLAADFADIFDVRGFLSRAPEWRVQPALDGARLTFEHVAEDGHIRTTCVRFDPPPNSLTPEGAEYSVTLGGRGVLRLSIQIAVRASEGACDDLAPGPVDVDALERARRAELREWEARHTVVELGDAAANAVVRRAFADLHMLRSRSPRGDYIAAGVPWYAALFGRDSLITALQLLPYDSETAGETLLVLARYQGRRQNPAADEEPGKILHELRVGDLARLGAVPHSPYYGSVDATPLFLVLAGAYLAWTDDRATLAMLLPHLEAAARWLDEYGDLDGDGYVEYARRTERGLINQGWKDSWDGIVHADGSLAEPPIALVEVQAYAWAGRRALAAVYRALGRPEDAAHQEAIAERLRRQFERDFWLDDLGCYALALDGQKRPLRVVTSNPGHVLWTGLAQAERGRRTAQRLMQPDMFSGWGIRTLSADAVRYNPVGYHLGTVWPHDNAIAVAGFRRYGADEAAERVAAALFETGTHFAYDRLPELLCGLPRHAYRSPVRYPVACSPQAWAAGTPLMLLASLLGFEPDAPNARLCLRRPLVPGWLGAVRLRHLRVGQSVIDLNLQPDAGISVVHRDGPPLEVLGADEVPLL